MSFENSPQLIKGIVTMLVTGTSPDFEECVGMTNAVSKIKKNNKIDKLFVTVTYLFYRHFH